MSLSTLLKGFSISAGLPALTLQGHRFNSDTQLGRPMARLGWGSVATFYDNTVDTLTPIPSGVSSSTVVDLPFFGVDDGTVRMVCNPLCDFQYYFQAAAVAPLVLSCPISNTGSVEGALLSAFNR